MMLYSLGFGVFSNLAASPDLADQLGCAHFVLRAFGCTSAFRIPAGRRCVGRRFARSSRMDDGRHRHSVLDRRYRYILGHETPLSRRRSDSARPRHPLDGSGFISRLSTATQGWHVVRQSARSVGTERARSGLYFHRRLTLQPELTAASGGPITLTRDAASPPLLLCTQSISGRQRGPASELVRLGGREIDYLHLACPKRAGRASSA